MSILSGAKSMIEKAYKRVAALKAGEYLHEVGLIKSRFDASRQARRHQEGEWAVCLSFMRSSGQWLRYKNGRLQDLRDEENYDSFQSANVYQSLLIRAAARACARRPDVMFFPKTEREFDKDASQEAEVCYGHYKDLLNFHDILRQVVTYALNPTTAYAKIYWDPAKCAEVPVKWDTDNPNEPTAFGMRPVGDPVLEFTPGHEIYLDPDAKNFYASRWVLQVRRVLTEDINARYSPAEDVLTDYQEWTQYSRVRQLIQSSFIQQPAAEDGRTTVYEYYERPGSARVQGANGKWVLKEYPQGRTIVCTETQCLSYCESLPSGVVPFIPLGWIEDPFTPYDIGLGQTLMPLQALLNGMFSQQATIASLQKAWLTREGGDGAGADLSERVKDKGSYMEVTHMKNEPPPTLIVPNLQTAGLSEVIDRVLSFMSDQSGVHDVSGGPDSGGSSGESGVAIRLQQDADQQLMSLFHIRVEQFCKQLAERILLLAVQNVKEPRSWSVDSSGNAGEPGIAVSSLDKLRDGGLVAVQVQPGSGTPQLPEMQDQEVLSLAEAGLVSPAVALKAMKSPVATRLQRLAEEEEDQAQRQQVIAAALGQAMDSGGQGMGGQMLPQGAQMPSAGGVPEGQNSIPPAAS